ncbi:MAG: hypothetical protein FWD04_11130 [Conexibacteraceae bacterium]|nr:hypothetical protein [Conexibacteraceae bacterium]
MANNDQDSTVPPNGWEIPGGSHGPGGSRRDDGIDSESLAQLIDQLFALVPPDLRTALTDAARALLEALRALIDWCVARLERRAGGGEVEVRDIPIL